MRSSDGHLCHPAHRSFHYLRLLVGSLLGGWALVLILLVLGFLGNISFSSTVTLASKWVLIGGSIIGIILGAIFAIIAAILGRIFPSLRKNVHPLALVRAGFIFLAAWMLIALIAWPTTRWAIWGVWIGPIPPPESRLPRQDRIVTRISAAFNPWARDRHRSRSVSHHGDSSLHADPDVQPRAWRAESRETDCGCGRRHRWRNGQTICQFIGNRKASQSPENADGGKFGFIDTSQPAIESSLWAKAMTGIESNGIIDSYSTPDDLTAIPMWDVVASKGMKVGLFQMLPSHKKSTAPFSMSHRRAREKTRMKERLCSTKPVSIGANDGIGSIWKASILVMRLARLGVTLDTIGDIARRSPHGSHGLSRRQELSMPSGNFCIFRSKPTRHSADTNLSRRTLCF